ncbi:integrase [Novosphingobium chloroacetimidivorans]|uniref:Integrase n=1 Tax=Novosphingobium chloroacetimidivorans TaxID=1428314 RepID=A0A7W7KCV0_9SPHN|nr:tyrosine-type recombinase/integrase [Novosphingobium chloroacetimidivorans]MBB4860190.1 integrase [Novosphingobium chloroacetimidivorans]
MTAASLKRIVEEALAEVGANVNFLLVPKGKARSTTWLGIEHGFGIRHYPSGRNVYIVQTRMAGRLRTVTIGPASVLTRHQAQMVARRVIAYAQVGRDPATDRKRIRSAPRFDDFLEEYWSRWSPQWKASTLATHDGYRRQYLDGAFKGVFIDELNEEHVTKWFAALNNRTGPGAANRTLEILKNMLNKAEVWGYRLENTNPCRSVRPNKRRQCERFLSAEELARFGNVLAELRASDNLTIRSGCAVITLLLLTGCRYREILTLQWQDVKGNRLLLRDSKTGPRTVWLGSASREVIDSLPRHAKIPWLFWNYQYRRPMKSIQHLWETILGRAALGKLRIHDLRHTFASHAAMSKETLPMIGRLLGHANHQSTARYAHLDDEHLLDAAQQVGDAVHKLLK